MPIGAAAALLIGSGVSAAAGLGAAKIQSNAAQKAQQAQQTATDKALAVQQATSKPYTDAGAQALQRLAQTPFQPYTQQFRPGSGNTGYQPFQPSGAQPTLGTMGQMPAQGPQGQPAPQLVTLQAPDGSTKQFPALDAIRVLQQAQSQGHQLKVMA